MANDGKWQQLRLEEVCNQITDGKHGDCQDEAGSGYYFLSAKSVKDGRLLYETGREITREDFEETHKRTRLEPGDILFTNTGTIGRMAVAPDDELTSRTTFQKSVALLKPTRTVVEPLFLYYLLRYDNARLSEFAHGTTQKNLLLKDFRAFPIEVPLLPEQRAIAHILGTLDDKIEVNRQMNETLEATARALFKSWFVDFDPVRAKMNGQKPLGMDEQTAKLFPSGFEECDANRIPFGWSTLRIGEICEVTIGGDWGKDDYFDNALQAACLRGCDMETLRLEGYAPKAPLRWLKASSLPKREMSTSDVLIAASGAGPCGRPLWVSPQLLSEVYDTPVLYSNFVKRLKTPSPAHAVYLDRVLFNMFTDKSIWDYITGTSVPNLDSKGLLSGCRIVVPPDALLGKFYDTILSIYDKLYCQENRCLAQLRDTLLPKLLSGEIRVADVERVSRRNP